MAKKYVKANEVVRLELSYSEVCMHMRVAGLEMDVRFQVSERGYASAQLLRDDGQEFSAAITPGEAGFYMDSDGWYCYPTEVR